jgi:hypothetical protein
MKSKIICGITGGIIATTSLWLGAWGMHVSPEWAQFPCFITAAAGVVGGIMLAIHKIADFI